MDFGALKVRHVNLIVIPLIAINNLLICIANKYFIFDFVLFFGIFVIVFFFVLFIKNLVLDIILFLAISGLSVFFGEWESLQGAIFLCFAFYCATEKNYKKLIPVAIIGTVFIIAIKFKFSSSIIIQNKIPKNYDILQLINYLIGYSYVLFVYYILIHPKNNVILYNVKLKETDYIILTMTINGKTTKEIASDVNMTTGNVSRRLRTIGIGYGCANDIQLGMYLERNSIIRQNIANHT